MARLTSGLIPKSSAMKSTSLPFMFDVDSAAMFASRQFLITGGTGFIGRHVVRRLLAQGASVRVFCRTPEKAQRLFSDQVGIARGDLCDRASIAAAVTDCDTVIHLGAAFQFGRKARRTNEETNIRGTKYLLEAGERSGICSVIITYGSMNFSGCWRGPRIARLRASTCRGLRSHWRERSAKWPGVNGFVGKQRRMPVDGSGSTSRRRQGNWVGVHGHPSMRLPLKPSSGFRGWQCRTWIWC